MKWLVVLQVAVMTILQPRMDARLLSTVVLQRELLPVQTKSEVSSCRPYVAQTWDNCIYTFKNNSFTGKVQATKADASYVGGIIGFYDSLNRIDDYHQ